MTSQPNIVERLCYRYPAGGLRNPDGPAAVDTINELIQALAVSSTFLELEAEGHAVRGDVGKAEACKGQAKANRTLLAKVRTS